MTHPTDGSPTKPLTGTGLLGVLGAVAVTLATAACGAPAATTNPAQPAQAPAANAPAANAPAAATPQLGAAPASNTPAPAGANAAPAAAAAGSTTPAAGGAAPAAPANPATRVTGQVQTVASSAVTLADGTSFTVTPTTRITRQQPMTPADLKPGLFVAITATRQPDNSLLASIVSVFPPSVSANVAAGQRPLPEGNLMTNATIDQVSGNTFTVTFPGGGAKITLAPDARLIRQVDATPADITPGAMLSVSVVNGAAQSVTIQ
jgi:hypothetical protein